MSGASGFIGSHLSRFLTEKGYEVVPLSRQHFQPSASRQLADIVAGCDVVINLAGAPIIKRWSQSYKKELIHSRVQPTRALADAILHAGEKPALFISASAVGYYPAEGCFDEYNSRPGDSFLSEVCEQWEKEALRASGTVRTVITRFGIVLAKDGGAFGKLALPARLGVSAWFSPGDQYLCWIALTDLMRAIAFVIGTAEVEGVVNLVTPQLLTNKQFCLLVGEHYKAHIPFKIPGSLLKLAMGEAAVSLMEGQCVRPVLLMEKGFSFRVPDLQHFLLTLDK
ncbi:MAG: TIGR01777 family oxidoreductase [Bacteroides sp.]|nr:TIGR01777 family oxidoreductase [Bacteroides sp.]